MTDAAIIASLLPLRTVRVLARGGIDTIEQIKASYPEKLLRVHGFGINSLRDVEVAFFPGEKYTRKPRKHVRGRRNTFIGEELSQYLQEKTSGSLDENSSQTP